MLDESYGRVSVIAYDRRYSGRVSMLRAIVGSSDESVESEGTFGSAQGTPSRSDAHQLDMQAETF